MNPVSKGRVWTGRALSAFLALFMAFDGVAKVLSVPRVVEATGQLGFSAVWTVRIGLVLLIFTCVYVIPRTSRLGAMLLTGYLGGAFASQVRIGAPVFSIVFPLLFAGLVWGALLLRDRGTLGLLAGAE